MTAWLSKRSKVVQETVNGMGDLNYIEDEGDLQYWSESHQKELEFQKGKALKSKVEAYNFNGLLDHEITDCLKEAAEGLAEKNRQHDKEMVAERRKSQIADARMTMTIDWSQLAGKVWVASDLGCGQELETCCTNVSFVFVLQYACFHNSLFSFFPRMMPSGNSTWCEPNIALKQRCLLSRTQRLCLREFSGQPFWSGAGLLSRPAW